jgi:hypothetical protein
MTRISSLPATIIFLAVVLLNFVFHDMLIARNVDTGVIRAGNVLLYVITLLSWFFHKKALMANNTQAFLRNVYSVMIIKMFVCLAAFFIYVSVAERVNKAGLLIVMFLYLVYTFVEIAFLLKYSKRSKNA